MKFKEELSPLEPPVGPKQSLQALQSDVLHLAEADQPAHPLPASFHLHIPKQLHFPTF